MENFKNLTLDIINKFEPEAKINEIICLAFNIRTGVFIYKDKYICKFYFDNSMKEGFVAEKDFLYNINKKEKLVNTSPIDFGTNNNYCYILSKVIKGENLMVVSENTSMSEQTKLCLANSIVEQINSFKNITINTMDELYKDCACWHDFIINRLKAGVDYCKQNNLIDNSTEKTFLELENIIPKNNITPTYIHGDFCNKNIMVLDNKYNGFIDYENGIFGHDLYNYIRLEKTFNSLGISDMLDFINKKDDKILFETYKIIDYLYYVKEAHIIAKSKDVPYYKGQFIKYPDADIQYINNQIDKNYKLAKQLLEDFKICTYIDEIFISMKEDRDHFHMYPELPGFEHNTSKYIQNRLTELEIPFETFDDICAVVGLIKGESNKTIAFRADMDALKVTEQTNATNKSKNQGIMHACGHDAHTAILLGFAKYLSKYNKKPKYNIKLIFQHAEERIPGGAHDIIKYGCLNNVDAIYGLHVYSPIAYGKVVVNDGAVMGSTDSFKIEFEGKGGHGGLPHEAKDAIVIASQFVIESQQIISRMIKPSETAVISYGEFFAGTGRNIIAETAMVGGTARCFNEEVRALIKNKIELYADSACLPYYAKYKLTYKYGNPPLINHLKNAMLVRACNQNKYYDCISIEPLTIAEDYANYLKIVPGCFVLIGASKDINNPTNHHAPNFCIDERSMKVGLNVFINILLETSKRG